MTHLYRRRVCTVHAVQWFDAENCEEVLVVRRLGEQWGGCE